MKQRRVVAGIRDGKEFLEEEEIESVRAVNVEITPIFRTNGVPTVPNDGRGLPRAKSPADLGFPGAGSVIAGTLRVPPHTSVAAHAEETRRDDRPGHHASDSVDVDVVIEGELIYEADDGSVVTLKQGDWIIKYGTVHAWHNRTAKPAVMAFFGLGAHRVD